MLQSRKWLALSLVPILPVLAFGFAIRFDAGFRAWLKGVQYLEIYMTLFTVAVLVCVFYASLKWWKAADEAVREAHKSAWFWGSMVGLCAVILPLTLSVFITHGQSYETIKTTFHMATGFGEFVGGMLTTVVAMLIGYAIAWALWWWKRG